MLELYDGKLSCTVLRRESGNNARDLSGAFDVMLVLHYMNTKKFSRNKNKEV